LVPVGESRKGVLTVGPSTCVGSLGWVGWCGVEVGEREDETARVWAFVRTKEDKREKVGTCEESLGLSTRPVRLLIRTTSTIREDKYARADQELANGETR
jgi:hypothetical protein